MPSLPEFWFKSFAFWAFFVPVNVTLLGVAVWSRGLIAGVFIAFTLFALSLLGVLALDVLFAWLTGPDIPAQGSYRSRALRTWAPWPLGVVLGSLPIVAWSAYADYQFRKFMESYKNDS